jgi:hypothetical protein
MRFEVLTAKVSVFVFWFITNIDWCTTSTRSYCSDLQTVSLSLSFIFSQHKYQTEHFRRGDDIIVLQERQLTNALWTI